MDEKILRRFERLRRFGTIYTKLDNILEHLDMIEAAEGESTEMEDCRTAVDVLATQIEVLRRRGEKLMDENRVAEGEVEKHNCTEYMEYSGEYEFVDDVVLFDGECKKCGKKLVQTYQYMNTRERETDKVIDQRVKIDKDKNRATESEGEAMNSPLSND